MWNTVSIYLSLSKPRIGFMVLISTVIGFVLATGKFEINALLLFTLLGTFITVAGSAALNNFLERDIDTMMARTQGRALPSGKISPASALSFGATLVLCGVIILVVEVNLLTGFLALLSSFLYVLVYTPLKRITWMNTMIGAIPGALPPVGGWAAATGEVSLEAAALFMILFLWQHPHFYAIAWMYRDDYRKAGFQMLPAIDEDGSRTYRQVILFSLLLIPISLLPVVFGQSGLIYAIGAGILGVYMFTAGLKFVRTFEDTAARGLLRASLIYLPVVLVLVVADSAVL